MRSRGVVLESFLSFPFVPSQQWTFLVTTTLTLVTTFVTTTVVVMVMVTEGMAMEEVVVGMVAERVVVERVVGRTGLERVVERVAERDEVVPDSFLLEFSLAPLCATHA